MRWFDFVVFWIAVALIGPMILVFGSSIATWWNVLDIGSLTGVLLDVLVISILATEIVSGLEAEWWRWPRRMRL